VKNYIFTPGPVAVPSEILIEMAKPIMHHRTKEFEAIFAEVREGLKYIYDTKQEVFVLAASGTGAMEAAVVNTLSRGDKVLVVNGGKFGERWGKMGTFCKAGRYRKSARERPRNPRRARAGVRDLDRRHAPDERNRRPYETP
jgi:aspartate aminotransferase-like enzyme